jgi:hypothetical protein
MLYAQAMDRERNSTKNNFSFPDAPSIAREILAYLQEHPEAQDNIEGIMQWWLLERDISFQAKLLREALAGLVKDGSVIEVVNQSGSHYKLNKVNA